MEDRTTPQGLRSLLPLSLSPSPPDLHLPLSPSSLALPLHVLTQLHLQGAARKVSRQPITARIHALCHLQDTAFCSRIHALLHLQDTAFCSRIHALLHLQDTAFCSRIHALRHLQDTAFCSRIHALLHLQDTAFRFMFQKGINCNLKKIHPWAQQ